MIVTVNNKTPVTADIDLDALARYLVRAGWTLWALIEDCGVRRAEWRCGFYFLTIFGVDDDVDRACALRAKVYRLAEIEQRQPGDVLLDIAGVASVDRGRLINAKATAGTRLVEAREAAARARGSAEQEQARARLAQAEAEYEAAARELAAAERR